MWVQAAPRLAALSAARKIPVADGKAAATFGRATCGGKRTPSISPANSPSRRASALETPDELQLEYPHHDRTGAVRSVSGKAVRLAGLPRGRGSPVEPHRRLLRPQPVCEPPRRANAFGNRDIAVGLD